MYNMTIEEALIKAADIARRNGFGVVVMRPYDQMCYADDGHPGTDMVKSWPVNSRGERIGWHEAYGARDTLNARRAIS